MELSVAICAESVIIDKFSNQASLINLRTHLRPSTFPYWIPQIAFVVFLEWEQGDEERYETEAIATLNSEEIAKTQVVITFKARKSSRQILNFQGLPISGPGVLEFSLRLPNEKFAKTTIPVSLPDKPLN